MSRRRHDLAGKRFGLLLALDDGPRDCNGERRYRCRCACGAVRLVRVSFLRNGTTLSCGALPCQRRIRPKPKPRRSAAERERDRAIAALVAAGGYGGANDARNWRDHDAGRRTGVRSMPGNITLRFIRAVDLPATRTGGP